MTFQWSGEYKILYVDFVSVRQVVSDPHAEPHGGSGPGPPVYHVSEAVLQDHPPEAPPDDPH